MTYSAHCRFDEEHFPCRERVWPALSVGQVEGDEIFQRTASIDQDRLTNFPVSEPSGSFGQGLGREPMVSEVLLMEVQALWGVLGLILRPAWILGEAK